MGKLADESKLYEKLLRKYELVTCYNDISLDLYNDCVDISKKFTRREIKFVQFKLNFINENNGHGLEIVDKVVNTISDLSGKDKLRRDFMLSVLETALDEMNNN